MIYIKPKFIDANTIETLLSFCRRLPDDRWGGRGFWEGRTVTFDQETPEVKAIAEEITKRIREEIFKASGQKLYPDCRNFARWREGEWMGPHADGDYPDGSFSWRLFGAVLYLNDDFDGGEIYFPNHETTLKPEPGTLVFFPGQLPYLHGVHEVTRGVRYNMASFWTEEEARNVVDGIDD